MVAERRVSGTTMRPSRTAPIDLHRGIALSRGRVNKQGRQKRMKVSDLVRRLENGHVHQDQEIRLRLVADKWIG